MCHAAVVITKLRCKVFLYHTIVTFACCGEQGWFLKPPAQLQRLNHGIIFQEWKETYYKASTSLQYRERKLEDAANLIESNLLLLGATAIEDKLQDQVSCLVVVMGNFSTTTVWLLT